MADLEQGTGGRGQAGGEHFGTSNSRGPSPTKSHSRRPPPFHTFPDPAPQPVPPRPVKGNTQTHKSPAKRPRGGERGGRCTIGSTNDVGGSSSNAQNHKSAKKKQSTHNPFTDSLTDQKTSSTLWDRVSTAVASCSVAIDEAATATENDGQNESLKEGTVGFGKTSNGVYGAGQSSHVSGATRKKRLSRAALKLRNARYELQNVSTSFDELREFATATQAALFRAQTAEHGVIEKLQSTAGYAEETTARLKQTSQAHKQAQMTAKQLGEALDAANAHIGDLTQRLLVAESEASEVRNARVLAARAQSAIEESEKNSVNNSRHKEAVAKLTADNMVFLMRLKESEVEARDAKAEADSMRLELEESRGQWFDRARKDVERVVQNAMKRAESADAALEQEIVAGERRAEEWGNEIARLRAVAAQNESLAATTARAAEALDEATAVANQNELQLRDSRRREFDALNAQKTATAAMSAAREEMGVLKQRMRSLENALVDQKIVNEHLVEKAQTSVAALSTQQQINAGVMRLKNDAEWRMLEMRAAFERAGQELPLEVLGDGSDQNNGADKSELTTHTTVSTPRLAGRPNPAHENCGVSHSALSPLPVADDYGLNTPMPISPSALAKATEEAFAKADELFGVCTVNGPKFSMSPAAVGPNVTSVLSEYAKEFAFDEARTVPASPNKSPAKSPTRSPVKYKAITKQRHVKGYGAVQYKASSDPKSPQERVGRVRAGMSTTARPLQPPLIATSKHGGYGATEWQSPARSKSPIRSPARSSSPLRSPTHRSTSPSKQHPGPVWGHSPVKQTKFSVQSKNADAVADARKASAEWSRHQAQSYREAQKSYKNDAYEEVYEYEIVPEQKSSPVRSPEGRGRASENTVSFKSSMASIASSARRRVDMANVGDANSESSDDQHDVVEEEVFLRAAMEKSGINSPDKKRHRGGDEDLFVFDGSDEPFDFGVLPTETATKRLLENREGVTSYGATK